MRLAIAIILAAIGMCLSVWSALLGDPFLLIAGAALIMLGIQVAFNAGEYRQARKYIEAATEEIDVVE